MSHKNETSLDHRQFMLRAQLPGTTSHCASGSSRFVIYPTGKITRCFGRTEQIGHLDKCDVEFIEKLRDNPECKSVTCIDPCDLNWTDKRSIRESEHVVFPQEIFWTGNSCDGGKNSDTHIPFSLSLFQINVTPTLLCNFSCTYCIAGSQLVDKKRAAKVQIDADKLIVFLEKLVTRYQPNRGLLIFVSGGESCLWNGLDIFTNWCVREPKVSLKINTNGSRFDTLRRIISKYENHGASNRLFLQLSAHVQEPQFSEDIFKKVCDYVATSRVSYLVALVGDRSGKLSPEKMQLLRKLEFHPVKVYSDFSPNSVENVSFPFLEGH